MHEDFRENIHRGSLNRLMISLLPESLNVLVIGAGRAAFIKANTFLKSGSKVVVVGKDISEDFYKVKDENLKIIKDEYNKTYLKGKHIIIIAIDNEYVMYNIIEDCKSEDKIYINCNDTTKSMGMIPMNISSNEIIIGINTLRGNPKGARFVSNKILNEAKNLDEFIKVTSIIRNNLKNIDCNKNEILDFIISDDFKLAVDKGKEKILLNLFYDNDLVDKLFYIR